MLDIPVECDSTDHFYSLVKVLNQQIGRGNWTTEGRPIRKLRRLNISNWFAPRRNTMTVTFKVPEDHTDIESVLKLWGN